MIAIALFRLRLLIKQKLGWGIIAAASAFFPFALFLAFSSYVRPDKIYWDLSLSFCYIVTVLLSTYLGTHLFHEELQRKTLSFVLTLKVSRSEWLIGNWIGIGAMLGVSLTIWTVLLSLGAITTANALPPAILFQAQFLLFAESLVILSLAMLYSLYLKPLLAWFAILASIALLHSKSYLEILVLESNFTGVTKVLYKSVLFILNFLPPLEWWDIKIFVGFQDPFSWDQSLVMLGLTIAWSQIFLFFSKTRMETMDL
jgi:ABC-type transport system involved in multi-copper enzyme maturation permease subunit